MSRQSNHAGARTAESGRGGRRRREGGSDPNSTQSQTVVSAPAQASTQASTHTGQTSQGTSQQYYQPGYDTDRPWEHTNPEAYRVVNDPHFGYAHQPVAPTGNSTYAYPSNGTAVPFAGQEYHHMNTYGSEPYHNPGVGLTADQLQALNNREQSMENINVWQSEGQRNGSWYGRVE